MDGNGCGMVCREEVCGKRHCGGTSTVEITVARLQWYSKTAFRPRQILCRVGDAVCRDDGSTAEISRLDFMAGKSRFGEMTKSPRNECDLVATLRVNDGDEDEV
ncbi:hypothetical protein Q3G72_021264 [Acer saccharum]|nr:hypothetical protein Q3G72_021264 [Acer saccharum]